MGPMEEGQGTEAHKFLYFMATYSKECLDQVDALGDSSSKCTSPSLALFVKRKWVTGNGHDTR